METPPRGFWIKKENSRKDNSEELEKFNNLKDKELHDLVWKKSMHELSDEINVSVGKISRTCKERGIKVPPAGYWKRKFNPTREELQKLATVKQIKDIARENCVDEYVVIKRYRELKSMGVVLKRAKPFIKVNGKCQKSLGDFI